MASQGQESLKIKETRTSGRADEVVERRHAGTVRWAAEDDRHCPRNPRPIFVFRPG